MNNRPNGRQKNVTGQGKNIQRRGSGLGTGPVGRPDGYGSGGNNQRNNGSASGGGSTRAIGGKSIITIIIIAALVLFGGGGISSLLGLFGGSSSGNAGGYPGFYSGGGSQSSGWTGSANTGKLNETTASGLRNKYTTIMGNGKDVVTLMVYMCGTDLESKNGMASADLNEMKKATLGTNVNLLVYTGGCKAWKTSGISNTVNQIYKIENGRMTCLVKDDGKSAMTDPTTLTRFINYCKSNYPANRYGLILWDHGGGSLTGYGYDERVTSSKSMTLKDINTALNNAGIKYDFIGFDACLMATLENGLMLEKYADYLIASEETEPGIGWYYTNWLTKLSVNTSMSTVLLGKLIVDDFTDECARRVNGQKTTLSVIDLAELAETVPDKLNSFAVSTSELMQNNGYKTVSDARSNTREFSPSSKIDQIDLVHLSYNLNTAESKALANALLGAVKYNRTSSAITNAYGISIYFPYQKTSKVSSAVATYDAIGMDDDYSRCIQQFAGMEVAGQSVSGGLSNPLSSLFGGSSSSGTSSLSGITNVLNGLIGTDASGFLGRSLDVDKASAYISENKLDASKLNWKKSNGVKVITLTESEWSLVHDLELNVFYDDGEGYIDLGLDNVFDFTKDGSLIGEYDGTWLAIDRQPVAYYYTDSVVNGDSYTINGRIPVLLNGDRADLLVVFDNDHPYGQITGATTDYVNNETETVAKSITELNEGDKIDFVCDYYTYNGDYIDSYVFGDTMIYNGRHEISNVYIDKKAARATYMFVDIYGAEYWTPVIK